MIENEAAQITLSAMVPLKITAYQIGPLAVHPMINDDCTGLDPANGYGVTLVENGKRLSCNYRTFKGMAYAVAFIRALNAERSDWARWFETARPPADLAEVFNRLQDAAEARGELTALVIVPVRG